MSYQNEDLKPCSDEKQNSFKGLKLKRCKFYDTKILSF